MSYQAVKKLLLIAGRRKVMARSIASRVITKRRVKDRAHHQHGQAQLTLGSGKLLENMDVSDRSAENIHDVALCLSYRIEHLSVVIIIIVADNSWKQDWNAALVLVGNPIMQLSQSGCTSPTVGKRD